MFLENGYMQSLSMPVTQSYTKRGILPESLKSGGHVPPQFLRSYSALFVKANQNSLCHPSGSFCFKNALRAQPWWASGQTVDFDEVL